MLLALRTSACSVSLRSTPPRTAPLCPHQVPSKFRECVNNYLEFAYHSKHQMPTSLMWLPDTLRNRLQLVLYTTFIQQISIFNELPGHTWISLIGVFRSQSVMPGEYIMHSGDDGYFMFFVKNGRVDIVDEVRT